MISLSRLHLSNSTFYDHVKSLGLNSKLDFWISLVLMEKNCTFPLTSSLILNIKKIIRFWNASSPMFSKIMLNARDHRVQKMNELKALRKQIFIKRRRCYLLVEFKEIFSFLNFYRITQRSNLICIVISMTNSLIEKVRCYTEIVWNLIYVWEDAKIFTAWLRFAATPTKFSYF